MLTSPSPSGVGSVPVPGAGTGTIPVSVPVPVPVPVVSVGTHAVRHAACAALASFWHFFLAALSDLFWHFLPLALNWWAQTALQSASPLVPEFPLVREDFASTSRPSRVPMASAPSPAS